MAVAQRMYARALFEAAQEAGRVDAVSADLGRARRGDGGGAGAARDSCATRRSSPTGKAALLEQLTVDADELVRNFVRLAAEKGRAGELAEFSQELEALVAQAQNRLAVELTTSYELSEQRRARSCRPSRRPPAARSRRRAPSTRDSSAASSSRSDRTARTAASAVASNAYATNSHSDVMTDMTTAAAKRTPSGFARAGSA